MDDPQAFMLESFVGDLKSEKMHQWPMFYWECEIDGYHFLVGLLFFIFTWWWRAPYPGVERFLFRISCATSKNKSIVRQYDFKYFKMTIIVDKAKNYMDDTLVNC